MGLGKHHHRKERVSIPRVVLWPGKWLLFEVDVEQGRVLNLIDGVLSVSVRVDLGGLNQYRTASEGLECVEISGIYPSVRDALQARLPDVVGIGGRTIRQYDDVQFAKVMFDRSSCFRVPATAIRANKTLRVSCSGGVTIYGNKAWTRARKRDADGKEWTFAKFSATFKPLPPLLAVMGNLDLDE
jgi:hypothetical protein